MFLFFIFFYQRFNSQMKVLRLFRSCNSTHIRLCVCVCPAVSLWTWRHFSLFQKTLRTGSKIEKKGRNRLFVIINKVKETAQTPSRSPSLSERSIRLTGNLKSITGVVQHAIHLNVTRLLFFFYSIFQFTSPFFCVFFDPKGNGKETISRFFFLIEMDAHISQSTPSCYFLSQPFFVMWKFYFWSFSRTSIGHVFEIVFLWKIQLGDEKWKSRKNK